jgi:hypothetical protein
MKFKWVPTDLRHLTLADFSVLALAHLVPWRIA